jgi:hypothetical protein
MLEQRQCQLKDAPEHVGKITIRTDVDAAGKEAPKRREAPRRQRQ